jgi:urease accessory protein
MPPDAIPQLTRLLQLASPALPVGAFSYSQGLESAVEAGIVRDAASAQRWIGDVLAFSLARMEAPVLLRLIAAWQAHDNAAITHWNALFLASREAAELRAETAQMGYSLARLLPNLIEASASNLAQLAALEEIAYPTAYACAVTQWEIDSSQALIAYLWSWLENQVMAALKAVPLGQTDGQKILLTLGGRIAEIAEQSAQIADDALGNLAPGLALLASRHETQYSRLFRS